MSQSTQVPVKGPFWIWYSAFSPGWKVKATTLRSPSAVASSAAAAVKPPVMRGPRSSRCEATHALVKMLSNWPGTRTSPEVRARESWSNLLAVVESATPMHFRRLTRGIFPQGMHSASFVTQLRGSNVELWHALGTGMHFSAQFCLRSSPLNMSLAKAIGHWTHCAEMLNFFCTHLPAASSSMALVPTASPHSFGALLKRPSDLMFRAMRSRSSSLQGLSFLYLAASRSFAFGILRKSCAPTTGNITPDHGPAEGMTL
mmetsp:Transcript_77063/g.229636  ORF Transcript_77063/g.229636 Transcript_77063/m.229636 type:complete len:258 (+) Transcript_77063:243-1016(+)